MSSITNPWEIENTIEFLSMDSIIKSIENDLKFRKDASWIIPWIKNGIVKSWYDSYTEISFLLNTETQESFFIDWRA